MRYKRKIFLEGYIDHFLLPRNQENALVFIREFVKRIEQICAHALFMNFRLYEYNAVITREYDSIVIRDICNFFRLQCMRKFLFLVASTRFFFFQIPELLDRLLVLTYSR